MTFNPDIHHRHSTRLKNYDYSSNGMYFVTICTQDRAMLFGEVVGADLVSAQVCLSDAGKMIESLYQQITESFPDVTSGKYIVMPNHIHCILKILNAGADRADTRSAPTATNAISSILQTFKSKTTVEYIRGVKFGQYPPFNKRIWQRNYYDHIIRDETDLQRIWKYIDENPAKWAEDEYYSPT